MRDRTPKMLVFPDLGSQVEAALNRPRVSACPWNKLMYPETLERSTYFFGLRPATYPRTKSGIKTLGYSTVSLRFSHSYPDKQDAQSDGPRMESWLDVLVIFVVPSLVHERTRTVT
jgi:hypothetical protein